MKYFLVMDENTLCYEQDGTSCLGCLAGSVIRGGRNPLNGSFHPSINFNSRKATLADFDFFRICSEGYKIDAEGFVLSD